MKNDNRRLETSATEYNAPTRKFYDLAPGKCFTIHSKSQRVFMKIIGTNIYNAVDLTNGQPACVEQHWLIWPLNVTEIIED